jgi:hypothetical protein
MKSAGGSFLAGAGSRLLPPSIPFRYFGAAVAFHLLAWLALGAGAESFPRFAGGLGWPLAALHLVTLGVLAMTAIGASLQLLPVATRQPVASAIGPATIWWVYTPGVAATALGMGTATTWLLAAGAVAVIVALSLYAALLAGNLAGARGMPAVIAHGWVALAALVVVLASGVSLASAYAGVAGLPRPTALALHIVFAAWGFMGVLAFGLSYILVPMFALSAAPDDRVAVASAVLAALALACAGVAAFGIAATPLFVAAIAAGTAAVTLHLRLMLAALRTGMRRELGLSFRLVRASWALLGASLALALAAVLDAPLDGLATLFVVVLVGGWLLTFLLGVLQRIVPFLASMHAGSGAKGVRRLPPTPSSLTAERPLAVHGACHFAALALLALAVLADSPAAARLAALAGTAGAATFGAFYAVAMRRMRRAALPPGAAKPAA